MYDLLVFSKYADSTESPKNELGKRFKVRDLCRPTQFLGIELTWGQNGSVLTSQKKLISKLFPVTGMEDDKAVGSSMDIVMLSSPDHQDMLSQDEKTINRSLVGSFMYMATRTHPEL